MKIMILSPESHRVFREFVKVEVQEKSGSCSRQRRSRCLAQWDSDLYDISRLFTPALSGEGGNCSQKHRSKAEAAVRASLVVKYCHS